MILDIVHAFSRFSHYPHFPSGRYSGYTRFTADTRLDARKAVQVKACVPDSHMLTPYFFGATGSEVIGPTLSSSGLQLGSNFRETLTSLSVEVVALKEFLGIKLLRAFQPEF